MTWIFLNFFFTIFPHTRSKKLSYSYKFPLLYTIKRENFLFCLHFSFHFRFLLRMKYNKNIGDVFCTHTEKKVLFFGAAIAKHKQFSIIIFHFARIFLCSTSKPFHDNGRILFFVTVISIKKIIVDGKWWAFEQGLLWSPKEG